MDSADKIELQVTVSVTVEGNHLEQSFKIPLNIPPIPIPTFLILTGRYEEDDPDRVFMLVRTGSHIHGVNEGINTINSLIQMLESVQELLGFASLMVEQLKVARSMTQGLPVAGIEEEAAPNLDDYSDFDEEPRASFLFGKAGVKVEFFSGEDYNSNVALQAEKSTFAIPANLGADFGFRHDPDWSILSWDSDPAIKMIPPDTADSAGCESCRFVDPVP
jgi:hypothetical protein